MSWKQWPTRSRGRWRVHGHRPNNKADRAASQLKTCDNLRKLQQIHGRLFRIHLHKNNCLSSILVSLYASFARPKTAFLILSSVPSPNLCLFNHAIRAFSKVDLFRLYSFHLYADMLSRQIGPDNFTFPFLLNCSGGLGEVTRANEIHGRVIRTGFLSFLPVSNSLIDAYAKCDELHMSRKVFDEMPARDMVSFNALLTGHSRTVYDIATARVFFESMPERNVISYNAMIAGYANRGELSLARHLFDNMPLRNVVSWTTMIVAYVKHARIDVARTLFEQMPERNLVSWTAMITGYSQCGKPAEALALFQRMVLVGIRPDPATMTGVISAAAQIGGRELANSVSCYVQKNEIELNERVLTTLVDMQAKCGNVDEACDLFTKIPKPDVFSYSALIAGLASHGYGRTALSVFGRMKERGVEPDGITFVGVLTACNHTGLLEEGIRFWNMMLEEPHIEPEPDHYACLVDMLGRAGQLEEAHEILKVIPVQPHREALGALLAGCKKYGNVEMAEIVASQLFELEPYNTGNYTLLASIYAATDRWGDAEKLRSTMREKGASKLCGSSWI